MKLSHVIGEYFAFRNDLSHNTRVGYRVCFGHLRAFLGDVDMNTITPRNIADLLGYLRGAVRDLPGVAPRKRTLSDKSLKNVHAALSSLWVWAIKHELAQNNIMHKVERPRAEKRAILPLTHNDMNKLLGACAVKTYARNGKTVTAQRETAARDRAIMFVLVDTGIRASELCNAKIGDFEAHNKRLKVFGKGRKGRVVSVSSRTVKALNGYLETRGTTASWTAPLFTSRGDDNKPLRRDALGLLLRRAGRRVGIACYPHKFRHTFAINFLKNGGNVYALQAMLGHSTLQMSERYLYLAQADVAAQHAIASPVEKWGL